MNLYSSPWKREGKKSKRLCKKLSQKESEYYKIPEITKEELVEKRDTRTECGHICKPPKIEVDMERPSEWQTGERKADNCLLNRTETCLHCKWRAWRNVAAQEVQKTSVEAGIKDKQGRILRQKWEGLREEDYQEKTWWRWQWWQREPRGREELSEAILKMGE